MILGHVHDHFPRVTLDMRAPDGQVRVEFVVDTGFDGELWIPPAVLSRVTASFRGERRMLMADKTPRRAAYFDVEVEWDGELRTCEAVVVDGRPLLGYEMMEGRLLQIEMSEGGEVTLETLS